MSKEQQSIVQIKPLYLARSAAASFLSLSESMLDKLVAQGSLPRPRKISAGRSAWLVEELETWGKSLPVSDLLPPANSGYGRAGKDS
jgi:predicted DNA-binding transcriptional regulator AlpA